MGEGTKDRAEGTWEKGKGKVKETAGELTDDRELEREGPADHKGAGKRAVGRAKDTARKFKDDVKDAGAKIREDVEEALDRER